jgi:hypothetical protein
MSWGDSWGDNPSSMARELALAFYEGRNRTRARNTYVVVDDGSSMRVRYYYNGALIARYTPESMIPLIVARRLETGDVIEPCRLEFCVAVKDRGCVRHLKALGLDACWQYGDRPILVYGAAAPHGWHTIEELKELPKWQEPVKAQKARREKFVNLTRPLFG